MGRAEQREHIFRMIFEIEFCDKSEMPLQHQLYFDAVENLKEKDKEYIEAKCTAIEQRVEEIDMLLNEHTTGWQTSRMNKVDLSILRLAVYEMKWDEEVPVGVAINEAVELGKKYSSEEGPTFINGVLAKLVDKE
ncbi:MAG: transcription antitermination factor NusB [Lachnospiraceae bacterium]